MPIESIKSKWLKNKNGQKIAPKTLVKQVQFDDGKVLEDIVITGDTTNEDVLAVIEDETTKVRAAGTEEVNKVKNTGTEEINKVKSESQKITDKAAQIEQNKQDILDNKNDILFVSEKINNSIQTKHGKNLIDISKVTVGYLNLSNGSVDSSNINYKTTDFIKTVAGQHIFLSALASSGNTQRVGSKNILFYNDKKTIIGKIDTNVNDFIVPENTKYFRISWHFKTYGDNVQAEVSDIGFTNYEPYFEYEELNEKVKVAEIEQAKTNEKGKKFPNLKSRLDSMESGKITQNIIGQNLFNPEDSDFKDNSYMGNTTTNIGESPNYMLTGYINVEPNDMLVFSYISESGNQTTAKARWITAFDSEGKLLSTKGMAKASNIFVVPDGVAKVRVTLLKSSYGIKQQIEKSVNGFSTYHPYEEKEKIRRDLIEKPKLHCYLPPEICVAVGRTIELYNNQVCLEAEKYHIQWICDVGNAFKRKFSVTGLSSNVGKHTLRFIVYDDNLNEIFSGSSVIRIVTDSKPTKNILPIGDSLTNWKAWLPEVKKLSGDNINFVGTRKSGVSYSADGTEYADGTIHHEGRSGFSAKDYLTDSTYTFDNRYTGNPSIQASVNPFWSGTDFDYNYYIQNQGSNIGGTPDAIQIFVGTNGLEINPTNNGNDIVSMVQKIRNQVNLPIFVCNTIYRSNQNGYASVGDDAYASSGSARAFEFDENVKVMNLANYLVPKLSQFENVYITPLISCHDIEYNFGQKQIFVNPRSKIQENIPIESVHPQASGYYQMADIMYSSYCANLK